MSFVNLHVHSEYSILDGACRITDIPARAKECGQTVIALTDHGNMFGAVDFYNECKAQGIKPIIGCEVYVARRKRSDKVFGIDSHPYHLILLCKNERGYKNLIKLVSLGYTEGFYGKPRIDRELIEKHAEGLICLSGCIAGEVASLILSGDEKGARETALWYENVFGKGNYFIEVQNHKTPEDVKLLPALFRLSDETGIPLAATNDSHYARREDANIQRVLLAVQTNTSVDEKNSIAFPNDEFYLKSEEEMLALFRGRTEAVENTARIAEMCCFEMEFGVLKLPRFDLSEEQKKRFGSENPVFLKNMCMAGLKKRYGNITPELKERLEYELSVVEKMGYTDYYLIVWDFVNYAKKNGIPVGPGRGSGAGSLAAYCIGITDIDPMKYKLLFERFLNPERVSMPDFDIDFCYERRQEVIDYVIRRYGTDHVAQIVTFGTMAAKAAVRDVARVTGVPYSTADMVSRLIPQSVNMTLGKALESSKDLMQLYESDLSVHNLIDTAAGVEGMPRNTSTHPAGVVICDTPVSDHVPLMARDGVISSQYTMTALEKVGLLKIDFLGLRNLTIISDCEKIIRKKHPDFSVDKISYDDPETYEMLTRGDTVGVFQFESAGMTRLLGRLRPRSVEDLTAALSLYRPGPMDSIPKYLENRLHPEKITYAHPILEDILNVTCGCIVYQEQVMEICRKMAGYSYGRADIVRRNMAKKKHGEMEKERTVFVSGAMKNGVPEDVANGVFDEMAGFASYAFNKSHAAAYSVVAFRTAYLKCHYFKEYMAALMTAFTDFTGKLMEYISCCEHRGVKILRPDINESGVGFTAVDEGIRFSLTAAKNIGRNAVEEIVSEREKNGSFENLGDLIKRMSGKDFSRRTGESLIKCGALDCFPLNRRQMIENYDRIAAACADITVGTIEGQLDFFGMSGESITADIESSVPYSEEYDYERLLDMEKEILGIYISGHPLQRERTVAKAMRLPDIAQMQHMKEATAVSAVFEVASVKTHYARNGAQMAFAVFEDMSGETEAVIFPSVYTAAKPLLNKGVKIYAEGKISADREGNNNFLPDRIFSAGEFMENTLKKCTLYIRTNSYDKEKTDACIKLLRENEGANKVYFRFEDIKKTIAHKEVSCCEVTSELLEKLCEIMGGDNVAISVK